MPFLTQQRLARHQTKPNFNIQPSLFQPDYARQVEESWLNLNQLLLHTNAAGRELFFSLEAVGHLVGEEIYWLQIETVLKNQVIWRGEAGVFYDETMPNIRFLGSIHLLQAQPLPNETCLYNLNLTLFRGTKLLDRVETSFEIRQVASESGQFYLVNQFGWKPAG